MACPPALSLSVSFPPSLLMWLWEERAWPRGARGSLEIGACSMSKAGARSRAAPLKPCSGVQGTRGGRLRAPRPLGVDSQGAACCPTPPASSTPAASFSTCPSPPGVRAPVGPSGTLRSCLPGGPAQSSRDAQEFTSKQFYLPPRVPPPLSPKACSLPGEGEPTEGTLSWGSV